MTFLRVIYLIALSLGTVSFLVAQTEPLKVSANEEKAIKKIETAKDFSLKMKAWGEFAKKFPTSIARGKLVEYLASEVFASKVDSQSITNSQEFFAVFTDQKDADLVIPSLVFSYLSLNNSTEAFSYADKFLPRNPDDVTIRLRLATEGSNQLRTGNKTFLNQTVEYSQQAISLIEANKKPTRVSIEEWKEYQTRWLPQLYLSLGIARLNQKNRTEALVAFEQAAKLAPQDPNNWYLIGTVYDDEYQEIAREFAIAEGKEKAELLKKAQAKLDQVIDYFARVVALTDGDANLQAMNSKIRQDLESYYTYRNKNLNGLKELIEKYKSLKTGK
jgi:tetratricopeptide (TPR) repeat protein